VLLDVIYWLLLGIPLVWLFYFGLLQTIKTTLEPTINDVHIDSDLGIPHADLSVPVFASIPSISATLANCCDRNFLQKYKKSRWWTPKL
jgi:hypothetical protein